MKKLTLEEIEPGKYYWCKFKDKSGNLQIDIVHTLDFKATPLYFSLFGEDEVYVVYVELIKGSELYGPIEIPEKLN
jgi:hypothetical protein